MVLVVQRNLRESFPGLLLRMESIVEELQKSETACLLRTTPLPMRIRYRDAIVSHNCHAWFLLVSGHLTEDQWVGHKVGLLETSHLCGHGSCHMPFHAVLKTHQPNVRRNARNLTNT